MLSSKLLFSCKSVANAMNEAEELSDIAHHVKWVTEKTPYDGIGEGLSPEKSASRLAQLYKMQMQLFASASSSIKKAIQLLEDIASIDGKERQERPSHERHEHVNGIRLMNGLTLEQCKARRTIYDEIDWMHELDEMCDDHYAELSKVYASEKSKALIIDPVQNAEALHRAAGKALEAARDALNDANEENEAVAKAVFDSACKVADSAATEYIRTKNEAKATKAVTEAAFEAACKAADSAATEYFRAKKAPKALAKTRMQQGPSKPKEFMAFGPI